MKEKSVFNQESGIRNQEFFIFDKQHVAIKSNIKENTVHAY